MPPLPLTVGELRKALNAYPDELEVMVQGDTVQNPEATPNHFVVEYWPEPPPFLLLAGIPYEEPIEVPSEMVEIENQILAELVANPLLNDMGFCLLCYEDGEKNKHRTDCPWRIIKEKLDATFA